MRVASAAEVGAARGTELKGRRGREGRWHSGNQRREGGC